MSEEEDDWFERAVAEDGTGGDGESTATADDDAARRGTDAGGANGEGGQEGDAGSRGDSDGDGAVDDDAETAADDEWSSPFEGEVADVDAFSDDGGASDPFASTDDAGESDDPFGEGDGDDPFGEGGGDDPFGGDESDDSGDSLFDDDFSAAFDSAPESGGSSGFEEEDFESSIPRIDLGIDGLDAMIQGGIPERHLLAAMGSAGTGKTTFGLQFLEHGLANGEDAVFITLEQSHDAIVDTAEEHGWPFETYEEEGRLAVIDLDPIEMANSLDNIRGELPGLVERFDADRLVLDSVSLLEMMYDDQARRRTEVFDFTRSLKAAGVTTMLTSEASEETPYASRYGIIEYLTDGVIVLQYVRSETRETRLAVEIQKIRDANHSRETKPYEITTGGISVYQRANIF